MWHGVLCYLFVDLPPPNPSPLFSTETPPRFTECHLRFSENTAKFCSSKALLGQKKHVKSFSFTAAFSPFYKVNWPSHYLSWSGNTLPRRGVWTASLLSLLAAWGNDWAFLAESKLWPGTSEDAPRRPHYWPGKATSLASFFQPLFRFFSFAFSIFIPFLYSWWCFAANLKKRKMARD